MGLTDGIRKWMGWMLSDLSEAVSPTKHYERIIICDREGNSWFEVGVMSDCYGGGLISVLNFLPPEAKMQWWCEGELVEESPGRGPRLKP